MILRGVLVSPECAGIDGRGVARHSGEFLPGNKPTPAPQRDQLADTVAIPGDSKGLPVLDGVHDLPGPGPQVALGDLGMSGHLLRLALGAIRCYAEPGCTQVARALALSDLAVIP